MPCQFIASCFYLENPWGSKHSSIVLNKDLQENNVINQEPQPAQDQPQVVAGLQGPEADIIVANVDPQAKAERGEVASSPNGTPDKACNKARTAKTFRAYLPSQCHRTYSCVHCR